MRKSNEDSTLCCMSLDLRIIELYRSMAVIDFTAKQIIEFKTYLITVEETYLLPVCAIYGSMMGE